MIKVSNNRKSKCMSCLYRIMINSECCCMYYIATGQRRNCPIGLCDKYTQATQKEHDEFWRAVNNMDKQEDRANKFTINNYRFIQKMKERDKHDRT